MKTKGRINLFGLFGFIGFLGFGYFQGRDIRMLSYFSFFSFFAYFWVGRIASEIADELFIENSRKAKSAAFNVALVELIGFSFLVPYDFMSKEIITVASSLSFASLIVVYAIAFYRNERAY